MERRRMEMETAETTTMFVKYGVSRLKGLLNERDLDANLRRRIKKALSDYEEHPGWSETSRSFARRLDKLIKDTEMAIIAKQDERDQMELF